jgi:integrative and conjugative element protein (TIGR02256 family)
LKFINSLLGLTITIDDELVKLLQECASDYYPNEFGGLLIGEYSEDKKNAFITRTILPKKFKSSRHKFERETEDLKEELIDYFHLTPSLTYVGEWYSHPDGPSVPSETDLKALENIVRYEEVFIDNPILLIISISKQSFVLGFYVYVNGKIYKYEQFL